MQGLAYTHILYLQPELDWLCLLMKQICDGIHLLRQLHVPRHLLDPLSFESYILMSALLNLVLLGQQEAQANKKSVTVTKT